MVNCYWTLFLFLQKVLKLFLHTFNQMLFYFPPFRHMMFEASAHLNALPLLYAFYQNWEGYARSSGRTLLRVPRLLLLSRLQNEGKP